MEKVFKGQFFLRPINWFDNLKKSWILVELIYQCCDRRSTLFLITINGIMNWPKESTLLRNKWTEILCCICINTIWIKFWTITTASGGDCWTSTFCTISTNLNYVKFSTLLTKCFENLSSLWRSKVNINILFIPSVSRYLLGE